MSLRPDFPGLRARAMAPRRAARSRREIRQIPGIASDRTLNDALKGEPPPEWTRRPRSTDGLRAVGGSHHGGLRADVLKGSDLYRRIEGWANGITRDTGPPISSTGHFRSSRGRIRT